MKLKIREEKEKKEEKEFDVYLHRDGDRIKLMIGDDCVFAIDEDGSRPLYHEDYLPEEE